MGPPARTYLDWNATAPITQRAREAAVAALETIGNASSVHAEGRASRAGVERARRKLAGRFGVDAGRVTFVSGGTEANATALAPGIMLPAGMVAQRLIVSAIEHPAVLSGGRFAADAVEVAPVTRHGIVDLEALEAMLGAGPPALVAIMAANNETGAIQPLVEAHALVHRYGGLLHSDAVQAFGRVPDASLKADMIALSGHKVGAPQGVGALVRLAEVAVPPLVRGGGQERGARAGTENVAAIEGFAAALDDRPADPEGWTETLRARESFEAALRAEFGATIHGEGTPRLANTTLFSCAATPAELTLIALDLAGVAVSAGSACSSGRVSVSHVLLAMGVSPEAARSAIRVSVGPIGAEDAYARFLVALTQAIVRSAGDTTSRTGPTYGL